jgi:hypothetical protein
MDYCKPHFEDGKGWDFKKIERNIYIADDSSVLWFDELLDTWMGPCRGSGVMQRTKSGWKIMQYIFSVTVPNDDIHKVIDIKSEWDSVFMKSIIINYENK